MKPPYEISSEILRLVADISENIGQINAAHLQKSPTELRKRNRIRTIQSSLEIEGNTLSIEQITSILDNKKIIGPKKDILEVVNAIETYKRIQSFKPFSLKSFCMAHGLLMKELVDNPGRLRSKSVGISKAAAITHIAPPGDRVNPLMNDLFEYLIKSDEIILIKSCVFHYEMEFIHPFMDGNGRMGRLWQTVILMDKYPVFEFLPVEAIIKQKQDEYYHVLELSDKSGKSNSFIKFMLQVIDESLIELLNTQGITLTSEDRINLFRSIVKDSIFTRKNFMSHYKNISTSTASRDLKNAVDKGILEKGGDKRTTQYHYRKM